MKNVFNSISKKGNAKIHYDFRNDIVHSFNESQMKKIVYGPQINAQTVINILCQEDRYRSLYSLLHDKSFINF